MSRQDPVVLNYHDSLLRQSDVDLLNAPHWLNDRLISFALEYLDQLIRRQSGATSLAPPTVLIGAEMAHLLKLCPPHEVSTFADQLALSAGHRVLLPVNDEVSLDSVGGTHWSLLVYEPPGQFRHFDSSNGFNLNHARRLVTNLVNVLGSEVQLWNVKCRQQDNGYDCGVHLIVNAFEVVAEWVWRRTDLGYDRLDAGQLRSKLLRLVRKVVADESYSELL